MSLADPADPEGDLVYALKTPWRDGTTSIALTAGEVIEKIVALIPPPFIHKSRYIGVLSSHSKWRRHTPHARNTDERSRESPSSCQAAG